MPCTASFYLAFSKQPRTRGKIVAFILNCVNERSQMFHVCCKIQVHVNKNLAAALLKGVFEGGASAKTLFPMNMLHERVFLGKRRCEFVGSIRASVLSDYNLVGTREFIEGLRYLFHCSL